MKAVHHILGYLGLIPFLGLAVLQLSDDIYAIHAYSLLVHYSALIITFLAGVIWMAGIHFQKNLWLALFSNIVMLISWLLLWLSPNGVLYFLTILLLSVYFVEYASLKTHYPESFFTLRTRLTLIASVSLIFAEIL